jgi:hypothetical protein
MLQNLIDFACKGEKYQEIIQISKEKFMIENLKLELVSPVTIIQHMQRNELKVASDVQESSENLS